MALPPVAVICCDRLRAVGARRGDATAMARELMMVSSPICSLSVDEGERFSDMVLWPLVEVTECDSLARFVSSDV